MYLIVGLGNPEKEYSNTRHNMGFNVINKIAKDCDIKISQSKFNGLYTVEHINGEKVILLKPQTYMNSSGECVIEFKNFYKIPSENIIVVYDDIDLEPGTIRIRKKGGPGTHNGMKSVVHFLQTEDFTRIRVGIGEPEHNVVDYVLGKPKKEDQEKIDEAISNAVEAILFYLKNDFLKASSIFNSKK